MMYHYQLDCSTCSYQSHPASPLFAALSLTNIHYRRIPIDATVTAGPSIPSLLYRPISKRLTFWGLDPQLRHCSYIYIYIIYTPNLGLAIAIFDREREQGRFKGSSERARGSSGSSVSLIWLQLLLLFTQQCYQAPPAAARLLQLRTLLALSCSNVSEYTFASVSMGLRSNVNSVWEGTIQSIPIMRRLIITKESNPRTLRGAFSCSTHYSM